MSNYSLASDVDASPWMTMPSSSSSWSSVWATFTTADLFITIAYFSIPIQILFSLYKFPQLITMPLRLVVLLVLFAFFIFLCGAGHLTRHIGTVTVLQQQMRRQQLLEQDPAADVASVAASTVWMSVFVCINNLTAVVSVTTAIYLLPLIPNLFSTIDNAIKESHKLNLETAASKDKLVSFMAFLCHEIRNPLFAITSSVQTLKEDYHWTGEPQASMECIHDASLLMLRLVNDVLDLSKMDACKLTLEQRNFDVWRLMHNLETCMQRQVARCHGSQVHLHFEVDQATVPRILYGDSTRVLQIAYNLLSNSVKFTSQGNIHFRVQLLQRDWAPNEGNATHLGEGDDASSTAKSDTDCVLEGLPDTRRLIEELDLEHGSKSSVSDDGTLLKVVHLEILCQDSGSGIAPDRLDTIFEPYSQAKLSDYRKHGGTGLGLSIVSSLIKLMGGSISVESTLGAGTTFRLVVPVWAPTHQCRNHADEDDYDEGSMDACDPLRATRRLPIFTECILEKSQGSKDDVEMSPRGVTVCINPTSQELSAHLQPTLTLPARSTVLVSTKRTKSSSADSPCLLPVDSEIPLSSAIHRKVLIVDDNLVNRKILGRMLSYYQIDYDQAVNGLDAVDKVRESFKAPNSSSHYGLIFMDLSMPIMDGFEAITKIREDHPHLPIVALTANALSQEKERAFCVGASDFRTKPILRNDLYAVCQRYLTE